MRHPACQQKNSHLVLLTIGSPFLLDFTCLDALIVWILHILGDVFAIFGPLTTRHIEMRSFAAWTEWNWNVALHRAVETYSTDTIVRLDVNVTARWTTNSPISVIGVIRFPDSWIATRLTSHVSQYRSSDVSGAFWCETTRFVSENLGDIAWQWDFWCIGITTYTRNVKTRFSIGYRRLHRLQAFTNVMSLCLRYARWKNNENNRLQLKKHESINNIRPFLITFDANLIHIEIRGFDKKKIKYPRSISSSSLLI